MIEEGIKSELWNKFHTENFNTIIFIQYILSKSNPLIREDIFRKNGQNRFSPIILSALILQKYIKCERPIYIWVSQIKIKIIVSFRIQTENFNYITVEDILVVKYGIRNTVGN